MTPKTKRFRWLPVLFLATSLCNVSPGQAQEIEFASSPNPVGSGARALGMGGAFIAVADDATAASWNPAGLIQLELPEVSIVGAGYSRSEDNTFIGHPEADGSQSASDIALNYLSAAYPFNAFDRNMIITLTYQHLYDFNRSWQFDFLYNEDGLILDRKIDYNQEGGLSAVGLSCAIQVVPSLSLGITMNVWNDSVGNNNWTQDTIVTGTGSLGPSRLREQYHNTDSYNFEGINFNLGFFWRFNEALTVGGVLKTPFTADVEHDASLTSTIDLMNTPLAGTIWSFTETGRYNEEMDMPMSYGLGVSYRFSDALTASLDVYRTHWEDMMYTDHTGTTTSAISGLEESRSDIDPTIQIRTGVEYLIIKPRYIIPLRAGLFYDPAPSERGGDNLYGLTLGTGLGWKQFIFDISYQFRFGNDVGSAIYKTGELSQDVREHTVYASLIVHF